MDSTNTVYKKSPGGAPANVAVGLSRLGATSTFIGKVGNDVLGHTLHDTLDKYGVHVDQMQLTDEAKTGITLVTLKAEGERSIEFFISSSADQLIYVNALTDVSFQTLYIFYHI